MNYGTREYLWLWSEAVQRDWAWPYVLTRATYFPSTDEWRLQAFRLKVDRDAAASVDILLEHGVPHARISERVAGIFADNIAAAQPRKGDAR